MAPPLQYHTVQYCSDLQEITVTSTVWYAPSNLPVTQDPMHVIQFVGALPLTLTSSLINLSGSCLVHN